jgi:hypothetical protein
MPRKRRPQPTKPNLAFFQAPVAPALDTDIGHAAYRLWHIVLIYAKADKEGVCWLENVELAALMRGNGDRPCSREYVRRLVGELSAVGLVSEILTDVGRRGLQPVSANIWAKNAADGPRFLESEDVSFTPPGPADNGGRATGERRTPHAVNYSCVLPSTIVDRTPHDDDEDINPDYLTEVIIPSTIVDSIDLIRLKALWRHYFGEVGPIDDAFLGELTAKPEFKQEAGARNQSPTELMAEFITTAAENKAKIPVRYIKKMWSNIVGEASLPAGRQNGNGHSPGTGEDSAPPAETFLPLPIPTQAEETIWTETQAMLRRQMTRATYDAIMAQTSLLAQGEDGCVVGVKSEMAKEWLENRLKDIVKRALASVLGAPVKDIKFSLIREGV